MTPPTISAVPKRKVSPPPPELLTLPSRLRYARERAGLTGAALAERAQIDPAQISRYENAERLGGIEAATLIKLAQALGVPVGWLAADEGGLPPIPVFREGAGPSDLGGRKR
jgi:transcriptional regulator with XRE-family HTH domain